VQGFSCVSSAISTVPCSGTLQAPDPTAIVSASEESVF
jgi:hypothetical protein